jgi:hypothetical protein
MVTVYTTTNRKIAQAILSAFGVDPTIAQVIREVVGCDVPYDVAPSAAGWSVRVAAFDVLPPETARKILLAAQAVELGYLIED